MMDLFQYIPYGANPYVQAAATIAAFYIVGWIVLWVLGGVVFALTKRTKTRLDDELVKRTKGPLSYIVLIIGANVGLGFLELPAKWAQVANNILDTLVVLFVTLMAARVAKALIKHWGKRWAERTESTVDEQLVVFFHRGSALIVWVLGAMFALTQWGVQIGPLITSMGIAGVAIAFALQSALGNVFGGISLILDKNIRLGEAIQVDEVTSGEIIDVGFRSTKIKSFDNETIIVPNGLLASSYFTNLAQPDREVRVSIPFGVAYGSDVSEVKETVISELKAVDGVCSDPEPYVMFLKMGDSSLEFKAYFHVDDYMKQLAATDEANSRIYRALHEKGIEIPYPQQDVHLKESAKQAQ